MKMRRVQRETSSLSYGHIVARGKRCALTFGCKIVNGVAFAHTSVSDTGEHTEQLLVAKICTGGRKQYQDFLWRRSGRKTYSTKTCFVHVSCVKLIPSTPVTLYLVLILGSTYRRSTVDETLHPFQCAVVYLIIAQQPRSPCTSFRF